MPKSKEKVRFIRVNLPVFFIKQDDQWVAYCPPLEVSSYGDTEEEAKAAFEDALEIFFEETDRRGTLERELLRMGWTLASSAYYPPAVPPKIIHDLGRSRKENRTVQIPTIRANPRSGLPA